jgi:hypothetical protein
MGDGYVLLKLLKGIVNQDKTAQPERIERPTMTMNYG